RQRASRPRRDMEAQGTASPEAREESSRAPARWWMLGHQAARVPGGSGLGCGCMKALILASTSSARRALMDGLGLPYRAESPGVDEAVSPTLSAREAVQELAARKARAVQARHPEAWVLGADQLVEVEGEVLSKPADRDA